MIRTIADLVMKNMELKMLLMHNEFEEAFARQAAITAELLHRIQKLEGKGRTDGLPPGVSDKPGEGNYL